VLIYPDWNSENFFVSPTSTTSPGQLAVNQNDLGVPISLQFSNGGNGIYTPPAGVGVQICIVDKPSGTGPPPNPNQLAVSNLSLQMDGLTFLGILNCNTTQMATFINTNLSASAFLCMLATWVAGGITYQFERQIPCLCIAHGDISGAQPPSSIPSGTAYIFNSTTNRFEWYINGTLVGYLSNTGFGSG
jgi:hypothetical protein